MREFNFPAIIIPFWFPIKTIHSSKMEMDVGDASESEAREEALTRIVP